MFVLTYIKITHLILIFLTHITKIIIHIKFTFSLNY
jgi:hypothetical protein